MENYLKYSYQNFIKKNSNDLMKNITTEANLLVILIQNFLMMLSEICVVFFIYLVMLYVDLKITLFVTVFMGINILLIKYLILNKTKKWGTERSKAMEEYYQGILFYRKSLDIIVDELESEVENIENNPIEFNKKIELKDICFEFEKGKEVLKNINLNIVKGEKIAFVGESGSGKTTLVDLITGLYKPKNGNVYLDDIKLEDKNIGYWRQSIGYIPQEVYLFDGTIADNVVFNREYNEERLIESLKKARIWEFLKKKEGIKTIVGDRGIMLSGGQK